MADYFLAHRWIWCPMCGPAVACGRCGNNACNAGRGTLADGADCPDCDGAYALQRDGVVPAELAERLALDPP